MIAKLCFHNLSKPRLRILLSCLLNVSAHLRFDDLLSAAEHAGVLAEPAVFLLVDLPLVGSDGRSATTAAVYAAKLAADLPIHWVESAHDEKLLKRGQQASGSRIR